ncbi:MAG: TonB-dependent receptor, partial [Pseudomonadota bacterium]
LAKYTRERDDDHFQLVLNGYTAEWTSTDQIPLRAVEDGFLVETENGLEEITLSRLGFIDPDLGGETTRISAAASYQTGDLDLSVYALYYDFELFSNFTYFLSDPLQGDEFEQFDRRWTFGGAATYSFEHEIGGLGEGAKLETRIGGDWRHDNIFDIGLYQTNARERIDLIRDDNLGITSGAAFIDTTMHWTPRLRMTLGARADYVAFTVRDAAIDDNEGGGDDIIFSPKASLAWRALDELEFYANYGEGFHSNDVRGVVIDIDPATLGPADRTPLLVKGRGGELGLRAAPAPGLNLTMAGFWVSLDSELVFVGDAGGSEPNEATRRFGFEAEAFWRPKDWLTLDASATAVNARFSDAAAGADRIPNAITNTLAAGVTVTTPDDFIATLRLRRFGPAPLIEDNSVRSDPTTTLNLRVAKAFGPMEISLDVLNLLDSKDNDITYFYESRLRFEGLPISAFGSSRATLAQSATARRATVSQPHTRLVGPPGIEDIHFHPLEPRTARLTLRANF